MSFLSFITGDAVFSSFRIPVFSGNQDFVDSFPFFMCAQDDSLMKLIQRWVADFIFAFFRKSDYSPNYYHPTFLRELLCQSVETPLQVDDILQLNYVQLALLEALQNKTEEEIIAFSGIEENRYITHKDWIVNEIVFNANTQSLFFARFRGNDEYPVVFRASSQLVRCLEKCLKEAQELFQLNNESLTAEEGRRKEKQYIASWWEERKRVEQKMGVFLENLEQSVMKYVRFLFQPWDHSLELKQCIDRILPYFGNDPTIRFFLHCNREQLSVASLIQQLDALCLLRSSLEPSIQSLLSEYNQLLNHHHSSTSILLCLSPELQNLPFEALPQFDSIRITRNLCLSSISHQEGMVCDRFLLSPGSYLLDISFYNRGIVY